MLCLIWDNFERYKLRYSEGIWIVSFSSGVILSEAISWKWTMDWLLAGFQQMRCWDFPKGLVVKTLCFHCRRCGFDPRSRRRQWQPTLVLLPGKFHGRRSLVGCIPWGREESDTTEQLSLSLFTFMHCRRKWQPTPVFLPGESQGRGSLVGCRLWGHTESDTTEVT